MIDKIASYFEVPPDYLLGNEQKSNNAEQEDKKALKIEKLFAEKGLPYNEETVNFFLDFVAANAEIIKKQIEKNK